MGILIGLVATLITILFNIFAGSALQSMFGTLGAAITELGFAVIALVTAIVYVTQKRRALDLQHIEYAETEYTIESVFPFKLPKLTHLVGGLCLMLGGYFLSAMYMNIVMRLFPDTYAALNDAILKSTYTGSFASVFCTVAIVPAVCEELLLRGAIQKTFSDLKKPMYTILLTGLMFGLFHIDPIRIPFAAMMGIILSYAYYRSGSIFVPIAMHFANNAYSVVSSWQLRDMDAEALMAEASAMMTTPAIAIMTGLFTTAALTFLTFSSLAAGFMLLEPNPPASLRTHKKPILACVICALALAIGMFVSIAVFGY